MEWKVHIYLHKQSVVGKSSSGPTIIVFCDLIFHYSKFSSSRLMMVMGTCGTGEDSDKTSSTKAPSSILGVKLASSTHRLTNTSIWSSTWRSELPMDFSRKLKEAFQGIGSELIWSRDQVANKPWGDQSTSAPRDFWNASTIWYPTWGNGTQRGLTVKSVKMWSQGACGSSSWSRRWNISRFPTVFWVFLCQYMVD